MNRGFIVIAIVLGVAATGGGAAYYLTDRYGSPDGLIVETGLMPIGFGADERGGAPPPPPGPPPPGAPEAAAEAASVDVGATLGAFDHTTQSLVWVLPPGVHAEGPFTASVTVAHNGQVKHESRLALASSRLEAGARPEFPAGSDVVQLSATDAWPIERDRIIATVEQLKAAHGPGGGELEISTDFKATIDESHRRKYCIEGEDLPIAMFIAEGQPTALMKVEMGDSEMILRRTILLGGCKAPPR